MRTNKNMYRWCTLLVYDNNPECKVVVHCFLNEMYIVLPALGMFHISVYTVWLLCALLARKYVHYGQALAFPRGQHAPSSNDTMFLNDL